MYIKEVLKKFKGSNKVYKHLRLVESVRTPKGPRQRTVLHLGNIDDLNISPDDYKILANAIEAKLNNFSKSLFNLDGENHIIEELANNFAERIVQERLNNADITEDISVKSYEEVDINSIENTLVKSIGVESIVISQLNEYDFDKILKSCGFTEREIIYAQMLIVSRLAHPSSERESARYLKEDSAVSEILNCDIKIYDNALHRVAIKLYKNKDVIENQLSMKAKDKFSLKENIILYDLTNTYLEGRFVNSELAKYGRSKEKRSDAKLITLALMTDSLGFPKKSKILKGNISEPGTLKDFLNNLENEAGQLNFSKKNIIMDAGIGTQENLDLISKLGLSYITVSRKKLTNDFFMNSIEEEFDLKDGKNKLTIKTHKTENETFLYCHSPLKAQTEESILKKRKDKFENDLESINNNLNKKGARKKYPYILERIGRLKERYKVGQLYNISFDLDNTNADDIKVNKIIFKLNNKDEENNKEIGRYILRTNNMSLTTKEISEIYRSLVTIESSFRSMKSDLDMQPIFHKKDKGIEAHLFANILAYHIVIPIITKLRRHKINHTWKTIRINMSTQYRITTSFKNRDNKQINIRSTTKATIRQSQIFKALKLKKDMIGNKVYKET